MSTMSYESESIDSIQASLLNAFLEYVTDFKTQFTNISSITADELTNGTICDTTNPEWDKFVKNNRGDVEHLLIRNAQKFKLLKTELNRTGIVSSSTTQQLLKILIGICQPIKISLHSETQVKYLLVQQPIIILSQCLDAIETQLKRHNDIKKVLFKAEQTFYIDISLDKEVWHGISIKASANTIECVISKLHWDVSGNSADRSIQEKANNAQIPGTKGYDGEHGEPGENGGNVSLFADNFLGMDKLSIYSNGGNGGHGEHGGDGYNGLNGRNGRSISPEDFQNYFQSPISALQSNFGRIAKAVNYLRSRCTEFEISCQGFDEYATKICTGNGLFAERYVHCKGVLDNNVRFEYGFTQWRLSRNFYVLFKGEEGTAGGSGGMGGLGGEAGLPGKAGKIELFYKDQTKYTDNMPNCYQKNGKEGDSGLDGKHGKNGLNGVDGNDIGRVDHYKWVSATKFTGRKFCIASYDQKTENSVWCSKYQAWRKIIPANRL